LMTMMRLAILSLCLVGLTFAKPSEREETLLRISDSLHQLQEDVNSMVEENKASRGICVCGNSSGTWPSPFHRMSDATGENIGYGSSSSAECLDIFTVTFDMYYCGAQSIRRLPWAMCREECTNNDDCQAFDWTPTHSAQDDGDCYLVNSDISLDQLRPNPESEFWVRTFCWWSEHKSTFEQGQTKATVEDEFTANGRDEETQNKESVLRALLSKLREHE